MDTFQKPRIGANRSTTYVQEYIATTSLCADACVCVCMKLANGKQ